MNNLFLAVITILLGLIVYFVKDIHGEATQAVESVQRIEIQNITNHSKIMNELDTAEKDRNEFREVLEDHDERIDKVEKTVGLI